MRGELSYPQTIADQIYALKIELARRGQEIPNCNAEGITRLTTELRTMQDQIDALSEKLNPRRRNQTISNEGCL